MILKLPFWGRGVNAHKFIIFCDLGFEEVAHPKGLKPPTLAFEARCSIQLSYGCKKKRKENINLPRSCVKEKAPNFLDSKKWGAKRKFT